MAQLRPELQMAISFQRNVLRDSKGKEEDVRMSQSHVIGLRHKVIKQPERGGKK